MKWLQKYYAVHKSYPKTPYNTFVLFAEHLGRIESYRALALTPKQYQKIVKDNSIWPTGRLRASEDVVNAVVTKHGVKRICYARLYIGRRLVQYDPSLSLHDDGETAVTIASGYMQAPTILVHLMKLSVPKISVLGYTVADVQDKNYRNLWFPHRGVWFDARLERTERYVLHEIPFLKQRLISLRIFKTSDQIQKYMDPFQRQQLLKKQAYDASIKVKQ